MNEKKFIELLNLYIDGESSASEAAAVERELQASAERRRIYNDYCRIQKATKLVYARFRTADAESAHDALPRVVNGGGDADVRPNPATGSRSGRPFRRLSYWLGGAAAASVAAALAVWTIPQDAVPHVEEGAPAPGAVIAGTTPAQANPVAATAADPGTFAAPFAQELRADPYLIQVRPNAGDPFSFAAGQAVSPDSGPASLVTGQPRTDGVVPAAPAVWPGDVSTDPESALKLKRILRNEPTLPAQQQPAAQPVNYRSDQ